MGTLITEKTIANSQGLAGAGDGPASGPRHGTALALNKKEGDFFIIITILSVTLSFLCVCAHLLLRRFEHSSPSLSPSLRPDRVWHLLRELRLGSENPTPADLRSYVLYLLPLPLGARKKQSHLSHVQRPDQRAR
jgi:hypothetical protein